MHIAVACGAFTIASDAVAQNTLGIGYGERGSLSRAQVDFAVPSRWSGAIGSFEWSMRWVGDLGYWRWLEDSGSRKHLWDTGITPAFRLAGAVTGVGRPYVDVGIGAHLVQDVKLGTKQLGSNFQFGDFVGVGLMFGSKYEFAVSFRVLHESNAGLVEPNNGLTVYQGRLEYAF